MSDAIKKDIVVRLRLEKQAREGADAFSRMAREAKDFAGRSKEVTYEWSKVPRTFSVAREELQRIRQLAEPLGGKLRDSAGAAGQLAGNLGRAATEAERLRRAGMEGAADAAAAGSAGMDQNKLMRKFGLRRENRLLQGGIIGYAIHELFGAASEARKTPVDDQVQEEYLRDYKARQRRGELERGTDSSGRPHLASDRMAYYLSKAENVPILGKIARWGVDWASYGARSALSDSLEDEQRRAAAERAKIPNRQRATAKALYLGETAHDALEQSWDMHLLRQRASVEGKWRQFHMERDEWDQNVFDSVARKVRQDKLRGVPLDVAEFQERAKTRGRFGEYELSMNAVERAKYEDLRMVARGRFANADQIAIREKMGPGGADQIREQAHKFEVEAQAKINELKKQEIDLTLQASKAEVDRVTKFRDGAKAYQEHYQQIAEAEKERLQDVRASFGLMRPGEQQRILRASERFAKGDVGPGDLRIAQQHPEIFGEALRAEGLRRAGKNGIFDDVAKNLDLGRKEREAEGKAGQFGKMVAELNAQIKVEVAGNEAKIAEAITKQLIPEMGKLFDLGVRAGQMGLEKALEAIQANQKAQNQGGAP